MKRADLERNFTLMVEHEIIHQLREKLGNTVTYDWVSSVLSDKPKIMVYIGRAGIEMPVEILAGQVFIRGLHDGYVPR